ncbi:MAG: hypothetical protein ACPIOQ_63160, partial [Promethearchaeia archaeon]
QSFCRQERRVADDQPKHPPVDASRRGDNRRQAGVAQAGSHVTFPIFVDLPLRPLSQQEVTGQPISLKAANSWCFLNHNLKFAALAQ